MKKLLLLFFALQIVLISVFLLTPDMAGAQENCSDTTTLCNPLDPVGVTEPRELVRKGFIGFASIIAVVAIAFVVFAGFKMVLAATEEARTNAKEALKWAIGGYLVALVAFSLIAGVGNSLGFDPSLVGRDTLENPVSIPGAGEFTSEQTSRGFVDVMFFIMTNVLGLLGFATILMLIYYGFRYITSAGNEETLSAAKDGIKWSLIGFILALFGFTIVTIIRQFALVDPSTFPGS